MIDFPLFVLLSMYQNECLTLRLSAKISVLQCSKCVASNYIYIAISRGLLTCADNNENAKCCLGNVAVCFGDPLFNVWPDYGGRYIKLKSVGK